MNESTTPLVMKMEKPDARDYRIMRDLHDFMASVCEDRCLPGKEVKIPVDDVERVVSEFIHNWWNHNCDAWFRVVTGGRMAIDNACDPDNDYLDFKPEIKLAAATLAVAAAQGAT